MPRQRKKPVLKAPLGPEGRKALADRVSRINEAGDAAREKLAKATGAKAGRKPAKRAVQMALQAPELISRDIAKAEARQAQLLARGAYEDADRIGYQLADMRRKLRRAQKAAGKAEARRAMQDRFRVLVQRSDLLDDWHVMIADRWLEAMTQAADGVMEQASDPDAMSEDAQAMEELAGERDPITGMRRKPKIEGPAIYLRGRSVLDRWGKAVPVSDVRKRGRKVPGTFDPKAVKAAKRAPSEGVQHRVLRRRTEASRMSAAFAEGIRKAEHPDWCAPVGLRVILGNEGLKDAMKALGVVPRSSTQTAAQTAMAAGLVEVARTLGMPVDK